MKKKAFSFVLGASVGILTEGLITGKDDVARIGICMFIAVLFLGFAIEAYLGRNKAEDTKCNDKKRLLWVTPLIANLSFDYEELLIKYSSLASEEVDSFGGKHLYAQMQQAGRDYHKELKKKYNDLSESERNAASGRYLRAEIQRARMTPTERSLKGCYLDLTDESIKNID